MVQQPNRDALSAVAHPRGASAGIDGARPSPWYRFVDSARLNAQVGEIEQLLSEALCRLAEDPKPGADAEAGAPDVTVIITAFQCGPHLRASVASLLNQSLASIEIIVVDDCSVDDTYAVACELAAQDRRVRALRTAFNAGTYVAKNFGLLHARGRYVTFQDSDDISHPDRLRLQLEPLAWDPDLVATTCHYCRIDEDSGALLLNRGARSRAGLISLMFDRERVLRSIGFFDSVRVNADDEFKTRLKRAFGAGAIRELEACHYFALLRADGLTVSGHTANSLTGTNLKTFLAPVRQRYTQSFQDWHRAAAQGTPLFVEFPGLERPFPAPLSIDPLAPRRSSRCTLFLPTAEGPGRLASLMQAESGLSRHIDHVLIGPESAVGEPRADGEARADATDDPITTSAWTVTRLEPASSADRLFKEAVDLAGGGILIIANSAEDFASLSLGSLRLALYSVYQQEAVSAAAVCQSGRVLLLHLDSLPVASIRIAKDERCLLRGVFRQALARGVKIEVIS